MTKVLYEVGVYALFWVVVVVVKVALAAVFRIGRTGLAWATLSAGIVGVALAFLVPGWERVQNPSNLAFAAAVAVLCVVEWRFILWRARDSAGNSIKVLILTVVGNALAIVLAGYAFIYAVSTFGRMFYGY